MPGIGRCRLSVLISIGCRYFLESDVENMLLECCESLALSKVEPSFPAGHACAIMRAPL